MGQARVRSGRDRAFLGLSAFLFGLVTLGCWAAIAVAASNTVLGGEIASTAPDSEAFLTVSGASPDGDESPSGKYTTTTILRLVPCPGRYRYQVETKNELTGAASRYVADVVVSPDPAVPGGVRCGEAPPARGGTFRVAITGGSEPFHLHGHRGAAAGFLGSLTLRAQPWCETYSLTVKLDLGSWHRLVNYEAEVVAVTVSLAGIVYPELGCGS